jgi:hypothetical protein
MLEVSKNTKLVTITLGFGDKRSFVGSSIGSVGSGGLILAPVIVLTTTE